MGWKLQLKLIVKWFDTFWKYLVEFLSSFSGVFFCIFFKSSCSYVSLITFIRRNRKLILLLGLFSEIDQFFNPIVKNRSIRSLVCCLHWFLVNLLLLVLIILVRHFFWLWRIIFIIFFSFILFLNSFKIFFFLPFLLNILI